MRNTTLKLKLAVLCIALVSLSLSSGCKKCVTCTEAHSGVTSDYCGTSSDVKSFEDELKSQGGALGQDWSCVDK